MRPESLSPPGLWYILKIPPNSWPSGLQFFILTQIPPPPLLLLPPPPALPTLTPSLLFNPVLQFLDPIRGYNPEPLSLLVPHISLLGLFVG